MSHRRILLISHLFPNPADSTKGTFMLNKASALDEAGVEMVVISPIPYLPFFLRPFNRFRPYRFEEKQAEFGGISVYYTRFFRPPGHYFKPHEGASMYRSVKHLAHDLHAEKPFDLVLGGMLTNDGVVVTKLASEFRIPGHCFAIGSDIHTYPAESRMVHKLTSRILNQLDGVHPVGENFSRILTFEFPGNEEKTFSNPLGVDTRMFTPNNTGLLHARLNLPRATKVALFVGRLCQEKGIEDLIDAIPRLRNENVFFVVVGTGPLLERIESLRNEDPRYANCIVYPKLDLTELVLHYQNADFFLFPSHMEGSPTVMIEAASCGLPILASDIPANHDVLREGENGHFFHPNNPYDLEAKVRNFLSTRNQVTFAQRSREIATTFYDRAKNGEALSAHLFGDRT